MPVNNVVTPDSARPAAGSCWPSRRRCPSTQPDADVENTLYEGWLYAAVANANGRSTAVYLTKDNGQTWTKLKLNGLPDPSAT